MRMLVTGASGQLARSLAALDDSTPGLSIVARGRPELDLTDPATLIAAIDRIRPDVVVNAAAYTAVDAAESDVSRAFAVNAVGAGAIATASASCGVPIIHISTDYVFSGTQQSPYGEIDSPDPRTVYGMSKRAGEALVASANPDHVILRTAWLYSPWGSNFVRTMLRLAGERDTIHVVDDQYGNPTYAPDLAEAILAIARRKRAAPEDGSLRGVFHSVGPESGSWCAFAREIMRASSELGGPTAGILPIAGTEYPTAAERPRNSRLYTGKIHRVFGVELPALSVSLWRCIAQLLEGNTPTRRNTHRPAADPEVLRRRACSTVVPGP